MITFREKEFSFKDDITAGLITGATLGAGSSVGLGALNSFAPKDDPFIKGNGRTGRVARNSVASAAVGAIVGAGLGALYHLVNKVSSASRSVNPRKIDFIKEIREILKRFGYKEGLEFTFDPKVANNLKSQVCMVISRSSYEMNLIVNTVNDKKFESLSNQIIKDFHSTSIITRKKSDKWNEITLSSMSTNNHDAGFVASLAERFIQRKYPVYIVEVE